MALKRLKAHFADSAYPATSWFKLDDDATLQRFLIAANDDDDQAAHLIRCHLMARHAFGLDALAEPALAPFCSLRVKGARPVVWVDAGKFAPGDYESDEAFKRHVFETNEAAERHRRVLGAAQSVLVIDLTNMSFWHIFQHSLRLVRIFIDTAQYHYPESNAQTFILHAPWQLWTIWSTVESWLDERTAKRIVFTDEWKET